MASEPQVTVVEAALRRRRRRRLLGIAALLAIAAMLYVGSKALRYLDNTVPIQADIVEHFKYGSIGSESASGLPYWVWQALPSLFAAEMDGQGYRKFGFLYEPDGRGGIRDLPIGISQRTYRGIDVVWFNCGICHTGTVRRTPEAAPELVFGMPANNFDLHGFIRFLFAASGDPRFETGPLLAAMDEAGAGLDWLDRLVYRWVVIPQMQEGLRARRDALGWLLDQQPAWGPGRVDTFNPYKLVQFALPRDTLRPEELIGTTDFPSIFLQGPRQRMNLHWDGNNTSLQERNLSAAIGAGVTEESVDHAGIERVAAWLLALPPPPAPGAATGDPGNDSAADPAVLARGRAVYLEACAGCHGMQTPAGYAFSGARIGQVEPIEAIGTDRWRFDSYTEELARYQNTLFADDPRYAFRNFRKTEGYANLPLDGLWLRGPYLHNGAVPTLRDLLAPPDARPKAFLRPADIVDRRNGGFVAEPCDPQVPPPAGRFCFDTTLPGNGNGGHLYGTGLPAADKEALLAFLLTF